VAGVSICFDIVDDQLITNMMDQGAEVIIAQTNNADFGSRPGQTDENEQQLAIAKMRAIETARSVVNVSTVASTRVIDAHGDVVDGTADYQAGTMVTEVALGTGTTPAVVASRAIELLVSLFGLAMLVMAGVWRGRRATAREQQDGPVTTIRGADGAVL
jgi:apolipoprotein N-acyltransferase